MKTAKQPTLIVLILALLIAIAFFLHREPRGLRPEQRATGRASAAEAASGVAADAPSIPLPTKPAAAASEAIAEPVAPSVLPGSIRGVVRLGGPAPKTKMYKTRADSKCEKMHAQIASEEFVVDPYGNLKWAFVYVKSDIAGAVPPAPKTPVILDQVSCVFTPHVAGIRVGQPLLILNSDDTLHTVHALPFVNKEFNFGLERAGMEQTRTFGKPEVMIKIRCDVHPWMAAWIGVLDHPYFAISNAVGSFVIRDLPPGNYQVEAWHEKCNRVTLPIGVGPGRESLLDFVLDARNE